MRLTNLCLSALVFTVLSGCAGAPFGTPFERPDATARVDVPRGVGCIDVFVDVEGQSFAFAFDVATGDRTDLALTGLPDSDQPAAFTADAHESDCASADDTPEWTTPDPVYADLGSNQPIALYLVPVADTDLVVDFTRRVVDVATGARTTYLLFEDGTLAAMGDNYQGELGTPPSEAHVRPAAVPGLSDVVEVVAGGAPGAGSDFACALLGDGTVWCLGDNGYGQLGDGSYADSSSPVQVSGLSGVTDISAGYRHACALTGANGASWCWGDNTYHQISALVATTLPLPHLTQVDVAQVEAGGRHTCGINAAGGTVWCIGSNGMGELGLEDPNTTAGFVQGVHHTLWLARGSERSSNFAVDVDGYATCWGWNGSGQLGYYPSTVPFLPTLCWPYPISDAVVGGTHTCLTEGPNTLCAGDNSRGQIAAGAMSSREWFSPLDFPDGSSAEIVAMAAGLQHTCVVRDDGSAWCFGANGSGQLGTGDRVDRYYPARVTSTTPEPFELFDESAFTGGVRITFDTLPAGYLDTQLSYLGVEFRRTGNVAAYVAQPPDTSILVSQPHLLRNLESTNPPPGGRPMTILFPSGVTRVGMYVGGKPPSMTADLVATLTAYDEYGDVILEAVRPGVVLDMNETFIGIDADEYAAIRSVDLLYTGADQATLPSEYIDDLLFQ